MLIESIRVRRLESDGLLAGLNRDEGSGTNDSIWLLLTAISRRRRITSRLFGPQFASRASTVGQSTGSGEPVAEHREWSSRIAYNNAEKNV